MFDKKLLGLVGGIGSANLIVTLVLSLGLNPGTIGPTGESGLPGSNGENGLPGSNGENGLPGSNGENGQTPYIGENGNWWIGTTDTGVPATGPAGENGGDGSINILESIDFYVPDFDLKEDSIQVPNYESNFNLDTFLNTFNGLSFTNISTEAELRSINGGGNYRLMNDITLTTPFTMVGDDSTFFTVNFDGNGHTIHNLEIIDNSSTYVGMFSQLTNSAFVNLTLSTPSLSSNSSNTSSASGLITGLASSSVFYQVNIIGESTSSIEGSYSTGALAGRSLDSVFYDITLEDFTVKGFSNVGGLVGSNENSHFQLLNSLGVAIIPRFGEEPVNTIYNAHFGFGGIVGSGIGFSNYLDITVNNSTIEAITGSYIEDPYNPGSGINLSYNYIGGVVGSQTSYGYNDTGVHFSNIYVENSLIVGQDYVGGIVGNLENALYYFINVEANANYVLSGSEANYGALTANPMIYEELTPENINNLNNRAGGIVGYTDNAGILFYNSFNVNGYVIGDRDIGGILGEMESSNTEETQVYFKNVMNTSNIFGLDAVGGLAGTIDSGSSFFVIENSANRGNVSSLDSTNGWNFAGFIGEVYEVEYVGLISNSYNSGNVSAYGNVGGFIGYNEIESVANHNLTTGGLIIYNTFNIGDLYGNYNVGGFVGEQYSQDNRLEIYNSLQAGDIRLQNEDSVNIDDEEHGMFIGENDSTTSSISIYNSYFVRLLDTNENLIPTFGYNIGNNNIQLPLTGILISSLTGGNANNLSNIDPFLSTSSLPFLFEGLWDFNEVWFFNQATYLPDLRTLAA